MSGLWNSVLTLLLAGAIYFVCAKLFGWGFRLIWRLGRVCAFPLRRSRWPMRLACLNGWGSLLHSVFNLTLAVAVAAIMLNWRIGAIVAPISWAAFLGAGTLYFLCGVAEGVILDARRRFREEAGLTEDEELTVLSSMGITIPQSRLH